jgi:hypothetical protein
MPRTKQEDRRRAAFKSAMGEARDDLLDQLRLLGAQNVVISTNIRAKKDGVLYATYREPEDPGVAVYFELYGDNQCIPCDKWNKVVFNVRAIGLCIQALRGLERWGAKEMVKASFKGFKALPMPSTSYFKECNSTEEIKEKFRLLSRSMHPDFGGDNNEYTEVVRQYKIALEGRE